MDYLRKGLYWFAALMLVAFASSGMAATKQFSFNVSCYPDPNAPSCDEVLVTVTNLSPIGNSNIATFTVTVSGLKITSIVQDQTATGVASINSTGTTLTVTNISPPIQGPSGFYSVVLFVGTGGLTCGSAQGTWTAAAYTGSGGQPFTNVGAASYQTTTGCTSPAPAACGSDLDDGTLNNGIGTPDLSAPGAAFGSRGWFDKPGVCGTAPDYSFTNSLLVNGTALLAWNTVQNPNAAFMYTGNGSLRAIPAGGFATAIQPKVAWVESPPGTPVFVLGLDCLGTNSPTNMPAPYAQLVGGITADNSVTVFQVFTPSPLPLHWVATLPAAPFPIVIGTERMQVTAVSIVSSTAAGTTYQLTVDNTAANTPSFYTVNPVPSRAKGGSALAGHNGGDPVSSTPLPIIPNVAPYTGNAVTQYRPGYQAHMCVQEYGVTAYGLGTVFDFATVIDIGDGGIIIGK